MSIFSRFPYTDFHRLNADWILEKLKQALSDVEDAKEAAEAAADDAGEAAATVETYDQRLTALELDAGGSVRYDRAQELTNIQQTQGRANIGAASSGQFITLSEHVPANYVRYTAAQSLTSGQKEQARENIGAAESGVVPEGAVRYDTVQHITPSQQLKARSNIGCAPELGVVYYDQSMSLTDTQKAKARDNIGAAAVDALVSGAVLYSTSQSLSTVEKNRARSNIEAASQGEMDTVEARLSLLETTTVTVSDAAAAITPVAGRKYKCTAAALTSLTITDPPASGSYVITFVSGSTPTTTTIPVSVIFPEAFAPAANTRYEINVEDGYAVAVGWPTT